MNRRTYLASSATAVSTAMAGVASPAGSGANADDPESLTEADDMSFERDASVAWIDERFIEYDSPDHPAVGTELSFRAMVLTNLQSEEERLQEANDLQWSNFDFAGDRILGTLFEPVSWVLDPVQEMTEAFYEKFELMKLVGVTEADQRFFDRHEYVPHVWAVGDDDVFYESGTIVEATGIVRYADQEDDRFAPGTGDGMYVELTSARPIDSYRSLTRNTSVGDTASFAGLQFEDEPTLTSYLTDVEYEHATNLPKPAGGSLVVQSGEVTEASFEVNTLVRDNSASLRTLDQQVIVGDTHTDDWGVDSSSTPTETATASDADSTGDTEADATAANTVAVIDVSDSMDDTDTRSGKTRLDIAKESVNSLVNYVESENRLGIVTFSTAARTEVPLRPVGGDRDSLLEAVAALAPRNDTSIGAGLQEAAAQLRGANGPKSIVLLSDGEENELPQAMDVLPDLTRQGITVYTIGMGSSADRRLLQRIADETGGSAKFAPDSAEIRSLYHQFSVSAQDRATLSSRAERLEPGDETVDTAIVDESCEDVQFSLAHDGGEMSISVSDPNGHALGSSDDDVVHRTGETNEVWTVENPDPGEWSYRVETADVTGSGETTIEVSANSSVGAELFISDDMYDQTGMMKVELKTRDGRRRYTGSDATVTLEKTAGSSPSAAQSETPVGQQHTPTRDPESRTDSQMDQSHTPTRDPESRTDSPVDDANDTPIELELRDDGHGPDPVADDGVHTGYFVPPEPGEYTLASTVSGGTIDGLERELTDSFTVDREPDVESPIRPYEPSSPDGFGASIRSYSGPAIVVTTIGAVLFGILRTMKEE